MSHPSPEEQLTAPPERPSHQAVSHDGCGGPQRERQRRRALQEQQRETCWHDDPVDRRHEACRHGPPRAAASRRAPCGTACTDHGNDSQPQPEPGKRRDPQRLSCRANRHIPSEDGSAIHVAAASALPAHVVVCAHNPEQPRHPRWTGTVRTQGQGPFPPDGDSGRDQPLSAVGAPCEGASADFTGTQHLGCGPKFNPIELCFARLKAIPWAARCRTLEIPWQTTGLCLPRLDAAERRYDFRHCGHSAATVCQ
jgi:hypothetical protein